MAELRSGTAGVLIMLYYMNVLLLSSEGHDVPTGSDITICNMKCPDNSTLLSLYKVCGGNETHLVELRCNDMISSDVTEPRFYLNVSSGCWTLSGAEKSDSCNYKLWLHNSSRSFHYSTNITVLDPVLITSITSNCSRLGEDIAVTVHFYGEETAVTWEVDGGRLPNRYYLIDNNRTLIIPRAQKDDAERRLRVQITNPVSNETREYQLEITDPEPSGNTTSVVLAVVGGIGVLCLLILFIVKDCKKKKKLKDLESDGGNDHSEEHGGLSGSSPDAALLVDPVEISYNGYLLREDGAEESHERDQQNMEERTPVTAPGVAQN